MSAFERAAPPFRLVEINYDDTLQTIAAREMGDANRWPELVWVNSLTYPYITSDKTLVGAGIKLVGQMIKVPAPVGFRSSPADTGEVYGRDCALINGLLSVDDSGDLAVVSGADNLRQQLSHLIVTPRGQLIRHPEYGCMIWRLLGTKNIPLAGKMGTEYVTASLKSDYRVSAVLSSTATVTGDVISVVAKAKAIDGSVVDVVLKPVAQTNQSSLQLARGWAYNYGYNWGH